MTIQEAIKGGKLFRRRGDDGWMMVDAFGFIVWVTDRGGIHVTASDIFADDWEIREDSR